MYCYCITYYLHLQQTGEVRTDIRVKFGMGEAGDDSSPIHGVADIATHILPVSEDRGRASEDCERRGLELAWTVEARVAHFWQ